MVVGLGVEENFVASDVSALLPVTRRFIFLEEGDVAEIRRKAMRVIDTEGNNVERPVRESELSADCRRERPVPALMLKEIHEQPRAIADTLQERVANGRLLEAAFGPAAPEVISARRRAHRRLRHELSCGRRRPLLHRADLQAAVAVEIASEYGIAIRSCRLTRSS